MKALRLVLSMWLSLAVPAEALASVTQDEHCRTAQQSETNAHAGHDMQGMDHSQHAQHLAVDKEAAKKKSGCTCGCNCGDSHCMSSTASLMLGLTGAGTFGMVDGGHPIEAGPARTAAAHHPDLIRPPSLS